jgi:hypothetical protein
MLANSGSYDKMQLVTVWGIIQKEKLDYVTVSFEGSRDSIAAG